MRALQRRVLLFISAFAHDLSIFRVDGHYISCREARRDAIDTRAASHAT